MTKHFNKALLLTAALSLAVIFFPWVNAEAACYSDGVRVGTIQKFSKKGTLVKSWEGELVQEGERIKGSAGNIRGGNIWKFSVDSPDVAKIIDEVTMTGGTVALHYCQVYLKMGQTDTSYIVDRAVARK